MMQGGWSKCWFGTLTGLFLKKRNEKKIEKLYKIDIDNAITLKKKERRLKII